MANSAKATITGLKELSEVLQSIPKELKLKVLPATLKRAAQPVLRRAKVFTSRTRRTGALRESLTTITRSYKNGSVIAVIGPDNNYYRGRKRLGSKDDKRGAEQPRRYAHLIEFGHHVAKGGKLRDVYNHALTTEINSSGKAVRRWRKTSVSQKATGFSSGFVSARPFMRPAILQSTGEIRNELIRGLEASLKRERRKGIKSGTHSA